MFLSKFSLESCLSWALYNFFHFWVQSALFFLHIRGCSWSFWIYNSRWFSMSLNAWYWPAGEVSSYTFFFLRHDCLSGEEFSCWICVFCFPGKGCNDSVNLLIFLLFIYNTIGVFSWGFQFNGTLFCQHNKRPDNLTDFSFGERWEGCVSSAFEVLFFSCRSLNFLFHTSTFH